MLAQESIHAEENRRLNPLPVVVAGAPATDLSGTFTRLMHEKKFLKHFPLTINRIKNNLVDLTDPEAMAALHLKSPLFHADKVTKPLLILAGKLDDRVSSDEVIELRCP